MCVILFAAAAHPRHPLIVAANRDEAYARPAAPAAFWIDHPHVYGGRDLQHGGTWLGVAVNGRFAAVTNYRQGEPRRDAARSRGALTRDYLAGNQAPRAYLEDLALNGEDYGGFSLIVGEGDRLFFLSNRAAGIKAIPPGVHGLSNGLLDEPWPKVQRGTCELAALLGARDDELIARLFEVLADRTPAPDSDLPSTGIALERERDLSPAFIAGERYGTRASTVLIVDGRGEVVFCERRYGPRGVQLGQSTERFRLDRPLRAGIEA